MQLCTVPPWNNIWGAMGIGAFYDRKFDDQDVCYKVCPTTYLLFFGRLSSVYRKRWFFNWLPIFSTEKKKMICSSQTETFLDGEFLGRVTLFSILALKLGESDKKHCMFIQQCNKDSLLRGWVWPVAITPLATGIIQVSFEIILWLNHAEYGLQLCKRMVIASK